MEGLGPLEIKAHEVKGNDNERAGMSNEAHATLNPTLHPKP